MIAKIKLIKYLIPIVLIIAGLIVGSLFFYFPRKKVLTAKEAAEKTIIYINENFLEEGTTASLLDVVEENGLYKVHFKVGEQEIDAYTTKNGKLLFLQSFDLDQKLSSAQESAESTQSTIGDFSISQDEICKEDGKPIVYFFGSQGCPHCVWEHPIIEEVMGSFAAYISFHNNMDSQADQEVFSKYSTGGIPTLVLGCKYYRVGSGERIGEEEEAKTLRALICKLTEKNPDQICSQVQELINQISE